MSQSGNTVTAQFPFRLTKSGVFWIRGNGDKPVKLAAPVKVVAQTRDADGNNWGRLLEWHDGDACKHSWAMPMEMLISNPAAVRSRLVGEGLAFINDNPRYRKVFSKYLQKPVSRRVCCVPRIGWHGNTYVLPDQSIRPDEETLYQNVHHDGHRWKVRGTADEWRKKVGELCSGNSRLILAASCGFAGPLLKWVRGESGGIHFAGATSTGKSTALLVGGSVCGGSDRDGFVEAWRTTINGLEVMAELHNDATLFLDELSQADAREAAEAAYMLGNGQGKARMTKNIAARKRLTWRLLYVSAGEITLGEHAASVGQRTRGGAEVRLLNVYADARKGMGLFEDLHGAASPQIFADELKRAARRCYGAPFRAFLDELTQEPVKISRRIRKYQQGFIDKHVPKDADGEVARAAFRFALIGAAGQLATDWGLTGWGEREAVQVAARAFREWLEQRGTIGPSDMCKALEQVRGFLQQHDGRFEPVRCAAANKPLPIRDRAGFIRVNPDGKTEYLIFPAVFRREVCKGLSYRQVQRFLYEQRFLKCTLPDYTIQFRPPKTYGLPSSRENQRVYCITEQILHG